ncbi:hypothetical protein LCGC14_3115190, partial [marine sediment metagenome]
ITVNISDVGCTKPKCAHRLEVTHRHHRRQETLFINAYHLRGPKKTKDDKYWRLCNTYEEFRPEDTVIICPWHHCEIHLLYDQTIHDDQRMRCKRLRDYTWPQAYSLMNKLRQLCLDWETEPSPGVDPVECEPEKRFPQQQKKRGHSHH